MFDFIKGLFTKENEPEQYKESDGETDSLARESEEVLGSKEYQQHPGGG